MKINSPTKLLLVISMFISISTTAFAHAFIQALGPVEMQKLQEKMIEEKFLNPQEVKELGKYDISIDNAYDKYIVCRKTPSSCEELKYDYKGEISSSTAKAVKELDNSKWWDGSIEWIVGGISLLFAGIVLVVDLINKKKQNI